MRVQKNRTIDEYLDKMISLLKSEHHYPVCNNMWMQLQTSKTGTWRKREEKKSGEGRREKRARDRGGDGSEG